MPKKNTSIWLTEELKHTLPPNLGPTRAIVELSRRYHALLSAEEVEVYSLFTPDEWGELVELAKGKGFAVAASDSILDALYSASVGRKDVQPALEIKLAGLSRVQQLTLIHLLETEEAGA